MYDGSFLFETPLKTESTGKKMLALKHQPFAVKIFTLQLQFGERSSPRLSPSVARENFNQFKITVP